jgi:hypothetical protein
MRIAFVGVKRKYQELSPGYRDMFNKCHLELPYYYARDGRNSVLITTVDYRDTINHRDEDGGIVFQPREINSGVLACDNEENYKKYAPQFDVVIHWRKWFPELYRPEAINVINCQDHSFSDEWKRSVLQAFVEKKLFGILCFPKWHKRNLSQELGPSFPQDRLLDGVTLGVDTDIYQPSLDKNPYEMIWASDPGRGISSALCLAHELFKVDRRFRLHVCHPDYSSGQRIAHPAVVFHGNIDNGPELWDLFGKTGILPYTSNFMEPSSRAHRQAMAAGSLVLYPPGMGTPSELIENRMTGIVEPIEGWVWSIVDLIQTGEWHRIGDRARKYALSERWAVQAQRFNGLFKDLLEKK